MYTTAALYVNDTSWARMRVGESVTAAVRSGMAADRRDSESELVGDSCDSESVQMRGLRLMELPRPLCRYARAQINRVAYSHLFLGLVSSPL